MGMISFNGVNYHNNGSKVENISEEEYQALVQAGEVDPNTIYFRYDGETSFPPVQNDGNATSLIDESIPTGQTIDSVLSSNFLPNAFTGILAINTNEVTDFGHNSFVSAGVLHFRGYCKFATALADQKQLFQISGKTAKFRSEGIIVTKQPSAFIAPIYITENSNTIILNSSISGAISSWCFIILDVALS